MPSRIEGPLRTCTACQQTLPLEQFYRRPARNSVVSQCKSCHSEKRRGDYRRESPEQRQARSDRVNRWNKRNREKVRIYHRKRAYDLSNEEYERRLKEQGGLCAICKEVLAKPVVDHKTGTKVVRGILCWHCNVALGHFFDCTESLAAAIEYLKKTG
jgi:hypothetical protein